VARVASLSTPFIAADSVGLGHPLYRWRRAYSTRHYRKVNIVVVGDSVAFGAGNSGDTSWDALQRGLLYKLQQKLNCTDGYFIRDAFSPLRNNEMGPGGGIFLRTAFMGTLNEPWTRVGSPPQVNRGIGLNSTSFNASNASSTGTQYIEVTPKSSSGAIIWYETGVGSVAPGVTVYDSAGSVIFNNSAFAVDTGLAQYTRTVAGFTVNTNTRGQYKYRVGRNGASGTAVVDGLYFFDGDNNSGVRVYNWAWPTMITSDFSASNTAADTSAAAVNVYAIPDLIIIYIGTNDYGVGTNPATFQTNISTLIDKYRAPLSKPPPVLLVAHWPRYDVTVPTFSWDLYRQALWAVARSKTESWEGRTVPYVDVLDLTNHFPTTAALDTASEGLVVPSPTTGWGVHPTDRGHSWISQLLADKLMQGTAV
jgi:lysophospholipase L1-like esterase